MEGRAEEMTGISGAESLYDSHCPPCCLGGPLRDNKTCSLPRKAELCLPTHHLSISANWLLAGLEAGDPQLLLPDLEAIQLDLGLSLEAANQPISNVYFPSDRLASIVARDASERQESAWSVRRHNRNAPAQSSRAAPGAEAAGPFR
jgi:hypothetical protein